MPQKDWITPFAVVGGAAAVIGGLWWYMSGRPPKEVPEGEWGPAGARLAKRTFSTTIIDEGWRSANEPLAEGTFTALVVASESEWRSANEPLAEAFFSATIIDEGWRSANEPLVQAYFSAIILGGEPNGPI